MNDLQRLHQFLSTPRKIVITTHHKPDGDALGSSLGLFHYLNKKAGHVVNAISPTDYPDFLHWLPGNSEVLNFELIVVHSNSFEFMSTRIPVLSWRS